MHSVSRTTAANGFLESSLSSVVSIDLSSSWAARSWQEALYAKGNGDAGETRFQQRLLQEKEQKLLRMFESQQQKTIERVGRGGSGGSGSSGSSLGAGKVRQLFDERRGAVHRTGLDRSHPLEPLRPDNGHPKAGRGASLDRTYTVLSTRTGNYKPRAGKVPVRRSRSQVRHDDVDNANNNQQHLEDSRQNGYNCYESFTTLPPEETHPEEVPDDNSNSLFTSQMNHVEEMMSKTTLLDNEEPPEVDLVEDEEEPEPQKLQVVQKAEDESDRAQVISKLPNVGGPLRVPVETAPAKLDRDRYKTYNASNGHPGQERRRLRTETEARKTRDLETKKSREVVRQPVETKRTRESPRQLDTTKTQMKSATPSRPSKANSSGGSPQPRSPAATPQRLAAAKKRTPTPVGRGGEVSASRNASSRAGAPRQPAAASSPKDDLVECSVCSRRFAEDRIEQHERICSHTSKKNRKVFDPVKQRVQGTEAETYVRKLKTRPPKETSTKKVDWRRKHEDFIATIRAAKQASAHLAAGGKVSDLPPPPPSDYSDYVQCPHCSRRFNEQVAARHVPKCATMLHNKPKPAARAAPNRRR